MRRCGKLLAPLVAVTLLAPLALTVLLALNLDRFRGQISALLSAAAGRPVTIEGPLQWSWQSALSLKISGVVMNTPAASVRVDTLGLRADISSLIGGVPRAQRVFLSGVVVDLPNGQQEVPPVTIPRQLRIPLRGLEIRDLLVRREGRVVFAIERIAIDDIDPGVAFPVDIRVNAALQGHALARIDGARLHLKQLQLRTSAGEINGEISIAMDVHPPRLEARLRAAQLSIDPHFSRASTTPIIPRVPLDLSQLTAVDALIEFSAKRLSLGELQLSAISVPITLGQGNLQLEVQAVLTGGQIELDTKVRPAEQRWTSDLRIGGMDAGLLLRTLGVNRARRGGKLSAMAHLNAVGANTDALLRTLQGEVSVNIGTVRIDAGAAKLAGADVFSGMAQMLRGTNSQPALLRCAVARFKVQDGLLKSDASIGAQTSVTNLRGGGVISMPDERLDLVFRPWPREGLGLSATALTGAMAVHGPFTQPEIDLTGEAIWRTGVTAGAALITGGLSLLAQGLMERARGDDPCAQAMGLKPEILKRTKSHRDDPNFARN